MPKSIKTCPVCTQKFSERKFKRLKREFDELSPGRVRTSHQPLSQAQRFHLLRHCFTSEGKLSLYCSLHLRDYAAIGCSVEQKLRKVCRPLGDDLPMYDPVSTSPRRVAHNRTSEDVIKGLGDFLEAHALPSPTRYGIKFIPAPLGSWRQIYLKYAEEHPTGVKRTAFNKLRWQYFPEFKVFLHPRMSTYANRSNGRPRPHAQLAWSSVHFLHVLQMIPLSTLHYKR